MEIRICKNCNEPFIVKSPKQEFCNDECKYNYYNVEYNCDKCGKTFLAKRCMVKKIESGERKNLYCINCSNDGKGSTDVINTCSVCGKEFRVTKAFSEQHYCSRKCRNIGVRKFKNVECPVCKKVFYPWREDAIFCSNECKFEASRNRVKCICHYCGQEIEQKRSEFDKNNFHYCSKACHYLDIRWSEHDKNVLRQNYGKISNLEISKLLEKKYSTSAIKSEAGRLGLYKENRYWAPSEEQILLENYSKVSMKKIMELLPNRTRSSILGKARNYNIFSHYYLTFTYSEYEDNFLKENYLDMDNKELSKRLNRSVSGISQHLWILGLRRPKEPCKYDTLVKYVRSSIAGWAIRVKKESKSTCCLTGEKSNIVLHHCRGFNLLFLETIDDLDFKIKDSLEEYTQQELGDFVEYFLYLQDYYGEYCCITESVHKLFHHVYGYGNNTMDQWNEFVNDFKNSKYKLSA